MFVLSKDFNHSLFDYTLIKMVKSSLLQKYQDRPRRRSSFLQLFNKPTTNVSVLEKKKLHKKYCKNKWLSENVWLKAIELKNEQLK